MSCKFPNNAGTSGYSKGCRCGRCKSAAVEYQRQYKEKYPARVKEYQTRNKAERRRQYKKRNPLKHKAHWMVYNHVRLGHLAPEPCEKCGAEPAQAHHDDYSKPLEVRWLCDKHHKEVH